MEKDFKKEKRRTNENKQDFKNEFVENSRNNEAGQQQQPAAKVEESYKSDREPNGMDPQTIIEKGYSFQESPDELRSQRMNRFGKEPNGINPENK
ncbi:hypothetical protein [Sporosarcina koreensis]|uniref:hypothetical protein n=1 Tax=Bacillales TaxID=1385 RepID=UPI000755CB20|nr:hypothetical protein [Sporosarcina koreensis]